MQESRGHHEARVDGASDDTTEGVPRPVVEPIVEVVEALFGQVSGGLGGRWVVYFLQRI